MFDWFVASFDLNFEVSALLQFSIVFTIQFSLNANRLMIMDDFFDKIHSLLDGFNIC